MHTLQDRDRDRYYQAAAIGLRALEARESRGRRLGPEADATWSAFAGDLHNDTDRLELLLRDAAVAWGLAFDARAIFGLTAVATDDPFGPTWTHANPKVRPLLDPAGPATLDAAARALGLELAPIALPPLAATSRLIVAGPSALAAVARAFQADPGLSWDRQVVAVADAPTHRQLAGLCALFTTADAPTRVLRSTDTLPPGTPVISPDAEPEAARALETR